MKRAVRISFATAMACLLFVGVAFGKTMNVGKAELVVPDAKIASVEKEEQRLQVGIDVFKGDVVQTGTIGAVILQFTDKTTLKIFPNSKVKLDNYVYDPDKTVSLIGLSLLSGAMRIASGAAHPDDKYQLRTPLATIGIRGTVIHIVSDEDRTVVEALHGTFYACATIGSACRTVSATENLNAVHVWNDGRIETTRARRDLGVRSAYGSGSLAELGAFDTAAVSTYFDQNYLARQSYIPSIGGYLIPGNSAAVGGFRSANLNYASLGIVGNTSYYSVRNSNANLNGIGGYAFSRDAGEFGVTQGMSSLEAMLSPATRADDGSGSAFRPEANANFLQAMLDAIPTSSRGSSESGGAPSPEVNTVVGLLLVGDLCLPPTQKPQPAHAHRCQNLIASCRRGDVQLHALPLVCRPANLHLKPSEGSRG